MRNIEEVNLRYLLKDGSPSYECKACRKEIGRKYYLLNKEKHNARSLEWWRNNPEKRQIIENRSRRKNAEKFLARKRKLDQRHNERIRDELRDHYVKKLLIKGTSLTKQDIPDALVKIKRASILLKRKLKELNK